MYRCITKELINFTEVQRYHFVSILTQFKSSNEIQLIFVVILLHLFYCMLIEYFFISSDFFAVLLYTSLNSTQIRIYD